MKIFLDTADTNVIKEYFETGLVDGVTTNPTLIMKSGRIQKRYIRRYKDIGVEDISMEVMGTAAEMYHEGRRLHMKFGDVATIKVPCTRDGLSVCKQLSDEGPQCRGCGTPGVTGSSPDGWSPPAGGGQRLDPHGPVAALPPSPGRPGCRPSHPTGSHQS